MHTIELTQVVPEPIVDIAARDLSVWYTDRRFERGHHYLITSESGKGKSSLFDFFYGRRNDFVGTISFDGHSIKSLRTNDWVEIRQNHLSLVFQGFRLFSELTVWENLQLKNQLTHYLSSEKLNHLLEAMGIADKRNIPLRFLSYGQQQRVAIVRSLCQPFDFLLLDEPFSHLDEINQRTICRLISEEIRERGAGLLLSSLGDPYFFDFDEKLVL
ncbi:ATP-binding cassette domain-containing protein [Microbacter margulisiae]|uniref:ABC-type lipoprotein export system ATPase subunit n=1 Tax=Microbacter margulisiae TaxID=1350067 RepID=A0A7W5DT88_9PORP|nr:ABC-type lipoprotein export system ATPase subunit [Microbacter margulisiae]